MIEHALMEYLANAVWQIPLLAGGAWLLLRTTRPSPRTQHWAWLAVLGLAVLLPMRGITVNSTVAMQTQRDAVSEYAPIAAAGTAIRSSPPKSIWRQAATDGLRFPLRVRLSAAAAQSVLGVYLAFILFSLIRIAGAWRAARLLVEHSREIVFSSQIMALLKDYGGRLRVKLPHLRESGEVSSPVIVGVVTPVLLLPENFAQHSENEIEAALCHELAHIHRRDYLVNLICQMAALPVVWHPVTYGVQQSIRRTREMACDAMAAQHMHSKIGYAKCLLALAQAMPGNCAMAGQTQALGLFSNHRLEERIMHLTEAKKAVGPRAKAARAVGGAAAMAAAFALAATFHISLAMAASKAATPAETEQSAPAVSQLQPAAPASSQAAANSDKTRARHVQGAYAHPSITADGKPPAIPNREGRDLEIKERHRAEKELQRQMADVQRSVAAATARLNSPEFKQQIAEAQRQVAEATAKLNSQEFKQQMAAMRQQITAATAKLNSPEFKQQMANAQRQVTEATAKLNSPEFKQQMANAQRQVAEATAKLNSPEFKQQMANAQRQVAEATAKLNSPEFKQQMERAERQIEEACRRVAKTKDAQTRCGNIQIK